MVRLTRGRSRFGGTRDYARTATGQFADTPDKPKVRKGRRKKVSAESVTQATRVLNSLPNKSKRKALETVKRKRQGAKGSQIAKAKETLDNLESKKVAKVDVDKAASVIARLPNKQKRAALEAIKSTQATQKQPDGTTVTVNKGPYKPPSEPWKATPEYLRLNHNAFNQSSIKPARKDDIEVTPDGHLRVWGNGSRFGKVDGSFRINDSKEEYKYSVKGENGVDLVLNKNTNSAKYLEETIRGVPQLNPWLRKMSDANLARRMAYHKGLVEAGQARAPMWSGRYHGKASPEVREVFERRGKEAIEANKDKPVDKKQPSALRAPVPRYGRMQLHHVGQWAKEGDNPVVKNADGKWEVDLAPKGKREVVVLAAKLHEGGSWFYKQNHPYFKNPDTGRMEAIGIPEGGDSGRKWFDSKFQPGVWKEIHRREVFVLQREFNRRIDNGSLSAEQAAKLLREAIDLDTEHEAKRKAKLKAKKG